MVTHRIVFSNVVVVVILLLSSHNNIVRARSQQHEEYGSSSMITSSSTSNEYDGPSSMESQLLQIISSNNNRALAKFESEEPTNDSEEDKDKLDIYPFTLTLKPVEKSLDTKQLDLILISIEELMMEELEFVSSSMESIKSTQLFDIFEEDWVGPQPMLRRGRLLLGGEMMQPHSIVRVTGGNATTTFDLYYDYPSEKDLNDAVEYIIKQFLISKLNERGFENLRDVEIEMDPPPPTSSPSSSPSSSSTPPPPPPKPNKQEQTLEIPDNGGKEGNNDTAIALSSTFGVLAAVVVALAVAIYARRKGHIEKLRKRYRSMRGNLKLKSLKRNGEVDSKYLVEVCTDEVEERTPPTTPITTPEKNDNEKKKDLQDPMQQPLNPPTEVQGKVYNNLMNPRHVRGSKAKMSDMKKIDYSQFVVEVCEE